MTPLILLAAALTLAAEPKPEQADDGAARAATIAPFVGEDVFAVAQVDLNRWEVKTSLKTLLGPVGDDPDVAAVATAIDARLGALKAAGATELYLLLDPADIPGYPVVVVPLSSGARPKAVGEILTGGAAGPEFRWPMSAIVRGAVVFGSAEALDRLRTLKPANRPELAEALGAGGESALRIALIPAIAQRRAFEESFPTLPPSLGDGPIEQVTRGMRWGSIALAIGPKPTLRVAVRGLDAGAAAKLQRIALDALGMASKTARLDPATAPLGQALAALPPVLDGETVRLEADLGQAAALVSVPVFQARDAARRTQCVNNLKQIGLAMHNYLATHGSFPPAYSASKDGKPLLSWRVHILPFVEEEALYKEFRQDEPWDSPHNKALIPRMPKTYACPSASKAAVAEGKTSYLTPRGPGTIFPGPVGIKIKDVTDGTSNTIMVVEAADDLAVIWTKPEDWEVGDAPTMARLIGHHSNGTDIGMADGSVKFFGATVKTAILKHLTTRDGGEPINYEEF
jgi:hypothetical protein